MPEVFSLALPMSWASLEFPGALDEVVDPLPYCRLDDFFKGKCPEIGFPAGGSCASERSDCQGGRQVQPNLIKSNIHVVPRTRTIAASRVSHAGNHAVVDAGQGRCIGS